MRASLLSYRNLLMYHNNEDLKSIHEFSLYSDSKFSDEINSGIVYSFLNLIPHHSASISPSIMVRTKWFIDMNKTLYGGTESYTEDFHGGWFTDEIAALASLKLGVRMHAGDITRDFNSWSTEYGQPRAESNPPPVFSIGQRGLIVPNAIKYTPLTSLNSLNEIWRLKERDFNFLIKSARSYQNALWICESAPNLAWLLMISAIETAAQQWSSSKYSNVEKFKEDKPELFETLNTPQLKHLISIISDEFSSTFGATKKFRDFCVTFLPSEPENRPIYGKVKWDKKTLKNIFNTIYLLRSKALHGGQPFPQPMCSQPHQADQIIEVGVLGALSTLGGTWTNKDAPINLNTFNHMVHSILNNWWKNLYMEADS